MLLVLHYDLFHTTYREPNHTNTEKELEQTDRLAHRRFNVQRFDVLPVLFQKGDEEVDAYVAKDVNEWIDGDSGRYALNMTLARTWSSVI